MRFKEGKIKRAAHRRSHRLVWHKVWERQKAKGKRECPRQRESRRDGEEELKPVCNPGVILVSPICWTSGAKNQAPSAVYAEILKFSSKPTGRGQDDPISSWDGWGTQTGTLSIHHPSNKFYIKAMEQGWWEDISRARKVWLCVSLKND